MANMKKRKPKIKNKANRANAASRDKVFTCSKLIMFAVLATFLAVVAVGIRTVWHNPEYFTVLAAFVGTPFSAVSGFYFWKSKNENVPRIEAANGIGASVGELGQSVGVFSPSANKPADITGIAGAIQAAAPAPIDYAGGEA